MYDFSKGGDDTFFGGVGHASNTFYGDALGNMSDHSKGGDDTFMGGAYAFAPPGGPLTPSTVTRAIAYPATVKAAAILSSAHPLRQMFLR